MGIHHWKFNFCGNRPQAFGPIVEHTLARPTLTKNPEIQDAVLKEIIHVPGKKTYIADALSRLHAQHTHPQRTIADDEMTAHVASVITGLPALETRLQQIIEAQEEDPVCRQMKIAPKVGLTSTH